MLTFKKMRTGGYAVHNGKGKRGSGDLIGFVQHHFGSFEFSPNTNLDLRPCHKKRLKKVRECIELQLLTLAAK